MKRKLKEILDAGAKKIPLMVNLKTMSIENVSTESEFLHDSFSSETVTKVINRKMPYQNTEKI